MMMTMTVLMMMASVAEGCEARACGVQIRRLPVKNTGQQETVIPVAAKSGDRSPPPLLLGFNLNPRVANLHSDGPLGFEGKG